MTLRLATENDVEAVLTMAKRFHEASPYSDLSFSSATSYELFRAYLEGDKTRLIIILSEQDGSPQGMVIGMASTPLFSQDLMATEIAWWMNPEYRKTRDSLLLIQAYEDWTRRIGCKITQVAMLDEVTNLEKFYLKRGFKRAEQSFIRTITNGSI